MSTEVQLPQAWFNRLRDRIKEVNSLSTQLAAPAVAKDDPALPVGVRALSHQHVAIAIDRFREITSSRKCERKPKEKLPRATEMRPYRFCVQDVVLAIWAMAHRKDESDILVDVFLTSEVYDQTTGERGFYDELAGAIAATLTVLSEAYRVGAPLRITFSKNVEGGRVPFDIVHLASRHGITIREAKQGRVSADEGRSLYLALTGFRPVIREAIEQLYQQGLMSPERAAYIVHHGVWSLPEVEGIVLCSPYPDLVLSGDVMPEHRHVHQHIVVQSRLALMGGLLDRSLVMRDDTDSKHGVKTPGLDIEDDERNLDIRTNARLHGREYVLVPGAVPDQLPLPEWECTRHRLEPGERLSVLLRPRAETSLASNLKSDIEQAAQRACTEPKPKLAGVAVPFDFHDLTSARQAEFLAYAAAKNVVLMVCPEATRSLDQMAQKKMAASRIKKD